MEQKLSTKRLWYGRLSDGISYSFMTFYDMKWITAEMMLFAESDRKPQMYNLTSYLPDNSIK